MEELLNVGLYHYLILALIIFCIGLWGVIVSKNIVKILICSEFMLNAAGINFVAYAVYADIENLSGLVFAIFIALFGMAELALGAALIISIFKYKNSIDIEKISDMKG